MPDFVLLAPVPRIHLDEAIKVLEAHPFVLFGSNAYELLEEVAPSSNMLIYPSHESAERFATHSGVYMGYERHSLKTLRLEEQGYRPASAVGEKWGGYWKVSDLKPLSNPRPLSEIELSSGGYLKGYPHGPLRITDHIA